MDDRDKRIREIAYHLGGRKAARQVRRNGIGSPRKQSSTSRMLKGKSPKAIRSTGP